MTNNLVTFEISESEYIEKIHDEILFMKKRIEHLTKMKNEKIQEVNKFFIQIYNECDYTHEYKEVSNETIDDRLQSDSNNEIIEKIYKKLILVCHPDKRGNETIFNELQNYYKNKDLYEILIMSNKLEEDLSEIGELDIHLILERKKYNLEKEIKDITQSYYYFFIVDDKESIEKLRNETISLIKRTLELRKENEIMRKYCLQSNEEIKNLI